MDPPVRRDALFKEKEARFIATGRPIVVVVDGSTSVSAANRTSPHIPDGFKGYRNYFLAVDCARGMRIKPANLFLDTEFVEDIAKHEPFTRRVEWLRKFGGASSTIEPYKLHFWYPGQKDLFVRVAKKKQEVAPKTLSWKSLSGPSLIFIQSGIEPQAVPSLIKKDFIGGDHYPVYFDDKDNFKAFYLDFEPGYGVVFSRHFVSHARRLYRELCQHLHIATPEPAGTTWKQAANRGISAVALDLDGTAAPTDAPLPAEIRDDLITMLQNGRAVVFLTEDLAENVDERVVAAIAPALRRRLTVFSDGGTCGQTFDSTGVKHLLRTYNEQSFISPSLRKEVLDIIRKAFPRGYEVDERDERVSPYRIDLRNVSQRDAFMTRVLDELDARGLKFKAYKAGKTSVKFVRQKKEDALHYWLSKTGVPESSVVIIGDSAGRNENDRELLGGFPEAASFNVGSFSASLAGLKPSLIQLAKEGVRGTHTILSRINQQGGALPLEAFMAFAGNKAHSVELPDGRPLSLQEHAGLIRKRYARPLVAVIGATQPGQGYTAADGVALGTALRNWMKTQVGTVFTGGVGGVGADVFKGLTTEPGLMPSQFFVLLPDGSAPHGSYNQNLFQPGPVRVETFGENMEQRRVGVALVSDIVVVQNGGAGTNHEAAEALNQGKTLIVLPNGGTGEELLHFALGKVISPQWRKLGLDEKHRNQIVVANSAQSIPKILQELQAEA